MDDAIGELSAKYGIQDFYIDANGVRRNTSDAVKRSLIDAMRVERSEFSADLPKERHTARAYGAPKGLRCYLPDWLKRDRAWGVATQLYAITSERNLGIGDFEDLAELSELAAAKGADFVGINPLHALFWHDPDRCSPYFPSTRQFLNPLYIAIDLLPGAAEFMKKIDPAEVQRLRDSPLVDYSGVAEIKGELLRDIFEQSGSKSDPDFQRFCHRSGDRLENFARFETLSAIMAKKGIKSGWRGWPIELHHAHSEAAALLLSTEQNAIAWHKWMQWVALEQLTRAQRRALQAGMRIGLYLDVAVGVAPDGAATWMDPELVTAKARIGCPPDQFNPLGQDWGLAPIIPSALQDRGMAPFGEVVAASTNSAGAVRIDHAMALERLYWIPNGYDARDGGYVRYPRERMLDVLAAISNENRTLIIGEDLGTVPGDFRDHMRERTIFSYRVFYFEREEGGEFIGPEVYPEYALVCIGTHDLPTFRGWWSESDIGTRLRLELIPKDAAEAQRRDRRKSREQLLTLLEREGFLHPKAEAMRPEPSDQLVADLHACLAAAPSRLVVAQLDDLIGAREQTNVPGTHKEYPNWRTKLPLGLGHVFESPLAVEIINAITRVRARRS